MAPDADQLLMRRIQAGDERAFEILVHKYQGLVLNLCRRYLGSRSSDVEDVAQAVFVRVFRGRQTYEPCARVKTWLYCITVNACLNEIRRRKSAKHRRTVPLSSLLVAGDEAVREHDLPAPEIGASAASEREEVARRVRQAVGDLPDSQRLALILVRFHGCSYEEAAETLETTVPAVKSLLSRARARLRVSLADLVESPGLSPVDGTAGPERG